MPNPIDPHATTPAAGHAPAAHPKLNKASRIAIIEIFNKFKKPLARLVVQMIPDPLQDQAAVWATTVMPVLSGLLAWATPDEGDWETIDDLQQDFFSTVTDVLMETVMQRAHGGINPATSPASVAPSTPSVDEVLQLQPPSRRRPLDDGSCPSNE